MLPSLQSSSKTVSINAHRRKEDGNYRRKAQKERGNIRETASFLPDIDNGFLTSSQWKKKLIDNRSMKPSKTRVKQRGGGFREYVNPNTTDNSFDGYGNLRSMDNCKTSDLPAFNSNRTYIGRGWSFQNPNPRLLKLQNVTGRFQKDEPFAYGNIIECKTTKTVANPHIEFLYQKRLSNSREQPKFIHTNGSLATLHDRFHCPSITTSHSNTVCTPSTKIRSVPSGLDEGCCVHRKTCSCDKTLVGRNNTPSRDLFKRWERSSRSLVSETSMHSSSGSSLCDQNGDSNGNQWRSSGPQPYFPKVTRNLYIATGLPLDNSRKTVKKSVSPRTDSQEKLYSKRRRSTHTTSNMSLNKKSNNKLETKLGENSSTNEVSKKELKTENDETESKEENYVEPEHLIDKSPVEMEVELMSIEDNDKNPDVLSDVESVTMVSIPCIARRVATPKILQIHIDEQQDDNEFSTLQKMFTKLDNDGDGHLSFNELHRSLPSDLTKRQLDYLKKIYAMACESTFFGFEEFVAVHQMCDVIAHAKYLTFKGFESVDTNEIEESLPIYLELFNTLDEEQTGSIEAAVFKELLASAMNKPNNSDILDTALASMCKTNNDKISRVELLAFLPYLISISSHGTES